VEKREKERRISQLELDLEQVRKGPAGGGAAVGGEEREGEEDLSTRAGSGTGKKGSCWRRSSCGAKYIKSSRLIRKLLNVVFILLEELLT